MQTAVRISPVGDNHGVENRLWPYGFLPFVHLLLPPGWKDEALLIVCKHYTCLLRIGVVSR